jgi:hypothetical protein
MVPIAELNYAGIDAALSSTPLPRLTLLSLSLYTQD